MKLLITIAFLLPTLLYSQDTLDEIEISNRYSYQIAFPADFRAIDKDIIVSTSKEMWNNYIKTYNVNGRKSERTEISTKNDISYVKNIVVYDIAKTAIFDVQCRFSHKSINLTYTFYPSGYSKGLPYDTAACQKFAHSFYLNILARVESSRVDAYQEKRKELSKAIERSEKKIANEQSLIQKNQRKTAASVKVIELEDNKIKENTAKLKQVEAVVKETTRKISLLE